MSQLELSLNYMLTFLQGKKTYVLAGLALVVYLLGVFGIVDANTVNTLLTPLGFGSILALRASISNL